MHRDHQIFIEAIRQKKKVRLTLYSDTSSRKARTYGPVFYVPSAGVEDSARYYVWNFDDNKHRPLLGLAPSEIASIEFSEEAFDPRGFAISDIHPSRV